MNIMAKPGWDSQDLAFNFLETNTFPLASLLLESFFAGYLWNRVLFFGLFEGNLPTFCTNRKIVTCKLQTPVFKCSSVIEDRTSLSVVKDQFPVISSTLHIDRFLKYSTNELLQKLK